MAVYLLTVLGIAIFRKSSKAAGWPFGFGFIFMIVNFFVGHYINSTLIHRFGDKGAAKITGSYATSTRYNSHDVSGYHVLFKTQEGNTIETSFEDDDFNVYPSHNSVTYPSAGDSFNVSYLRHFPGAFVIITNDDSPWAKDRQCKTLQSTLYEAQQKYDFDRANLKYQKAYISAIQSIIQNRCYTDSDDLRKYYGDIKLVRQGKAL